MNKPITNILIVSFNCFLGLVLVLIWAKPSNFAYGQSPTKKAISITPSPAIPEENSVIEKLKKIESLKEKIATKVAQLRESDKGVVYGAAKKIDASLITLTTRTGEKNASVSEDTLVYTLNPDGKTETTLKKITEGQSIVVFGYYDEKKEILSAKYIYLYTASKRLKGKIIDLDKSNYTISFKTNDGSYTGDVETTTKTWVLGKDGKLVKGGFSKFKIGDYINLWGKPDGKKENTLSANRIIIALQAPDASVTVAPAQKMTPSPVPTE